MLTPEYKKRMNIAELILNDYSLNTLTAQEADAMLKALYQGNVTVKQQDRERLGKYVRAHEAELEEMEQ